MQGGNAGLHQLLRLHGAPFDACLADAAVVLAFFHLFLQIFRDRDAESPWQGIDLARVAIGFRPGMMGTVIPASRHWLTKSKYFRLSKNIWVTIYSAPASIFCFQVLDVGAHVRGFRMLFGITGHTYGKICRECVYQFFILVNATVQVHDLADQVYGIMVPSLFRV